MSDPPERKFSGPLLDSRGPCPYGLCDGTGLHLDDRDDARPCPCRSERLALARTRGLSKEIPAKYKGVELDRTPAKDFDPTIVRHVRRYCTTIDERLDKGDGIGFFGDRGTGKTTLAMICSKHAIRARRTVVIYTAPHLLNAIRETYEASSDFAYMQLIERLTSVDLLHIEDLKVHKPSEWSLEQLYTIVNTRYEDRRAILYTCDAQQPEELGEHIGMRTASRLLEMCGDPIPMKGKDYRLELAKKGPGGIGELGSV